MDKEQLHLILRDKSIPVFDKKTSQELESAVQKYPYFAALQYANFSAKDQPTAHDIAHLALFKGDPYLFACFVQEVQNIKKPIPEPVIQEDILSLINELPNTNPIEEAKEQKISSATPTAAKTVETPSAAAPAFVFTDEKEEDKSLMVMMSFTDWLFHFKTKTEREREEEKDKKALKTAWQKEKLAAATEEENEEIPEAIFKLAMDSISENSIISESLAKVLAKQGKTDKAIEMYKKLSLRNPEKNLYFADRIKELTTIKDY